MLKCLCRVTAVEQARLPRSDVGNLEILHERPVNRRFNSGNGVCAPALGNKRKQDSRNCLHYRWGLVRLRSHNFLPFPIPENTFVLVLLTGIQMFSSVSPVFAF